MRDEEPTRREEGKSADAEQPFAVIVQAQALDKHGRPAAAPLAFAVSADARSSSLSDFRDLDQLKVLLREDFRIAGTEANVGSILAAEAFKKIFVQTVSVSFDPETEVSVFATWTGIEGFEDAAEVNYVVTRQGSSELKNFGRDFAKAIFELRLVQKRAAPAVDQDFVKRQTREAKPS